jgi:hypothetical protein
MVICGLGASRTLAQPAAPQPPNPNLVPPGGAPVTPAPATPEVETRLMPSDRIQHKSLEDVLRTLNEKVPGFNSVVVRSPQVPAGYPEIDDLTPKNVTVGQFMQFVRSSFPAVTIEPIEGPNGMLYAVHIGVPTNGGPWDMAGVPGMPPTAVGQFAQPNLVEPTQVKVYRLDDIVASLVNDDTPQARKKAMDDVLSLIQAALDQAGGTDKVVLNVHEATQTLVFKGAMSKMAILEQVLDTLKPKWVATTNGGSVIGASGMARMVSQLDRQNRDLTRQMQELSAEVQALKLATAATTRPN